LWNHTGSIPQQQEQVPKATAAVVALDQGHNFRGKSSWVSPKQVACRPGPLVTSGSALSVGPLRKRQAAFCPLEVKGKGSPANCLTGGDQGRKLRLFLPPATLLLKLIGVAEAYTIRFAGWSTCPGTRGCARSGLARCASVCGKDEIRPGSSPLSVFGTVFSFENVRDYIGSW
jgi:hypothetical protein